MLGVKDCEERREDMVKIFSVKHPQLLEKDINEFLKKENPTYIKRIIPIVPSDISKGFSIILWYEKRVERKRKVIKECQVKCQFCDSKERDRHGSWIEGNFYCNECLKSKLNI